MAELRLNDVFPAWKEPTYETELGTGGIFHFLDHFSPPWGDSDIQEELDLVYHGTYSGQKIVGPLVLAYLEDDDSLLPASQEKLARSIKYLCGERWSKEWAVKLQEYNPIQNYSMVEDETPAETTDTNSGETSLFGFNSITPVGDSTGSGSVVHTTQTERHLERSGNIGVTTSQQMLRSEIDLWMWDFFREVVFPDIDRILTLGTY